MVGTVEVNPKFHFRLNLTRATPSVTCEVKSLPNCVRPRHHPPDSRLLTLHRTSPPFPPFSLYQEIINFYISPSAEEGDLISHHQQQQQQQETESPSSSSNHVAETALFGSAQNPNPSHLLGRRPMPIGRIRSRPFPHPQAPPLLLQHHPYWYISNP